MDFPAYVPAAVREHLTHYLEGESDRSIPGYIELLASADREVAGYDDAISAYVSKWEGFNLARDPYFEGLRRRRAEAVKHRDMLAGEVDYLRRLARDARMRNAFTFLTREFTDDQQWRSFIHCAWSAKIDFSKFRESRKRATELKAEIADAADGLATLIRQLSETGTSGPDELFSVPELLRKTDNLDRGQDDLQLWRATRHYVLGDRPRRDVPENELSKGDQPSTPITVVRTILEPDEKPDIDSKRVERNHLRYVWGLAPDFSELLDTVARAARNFDPDPSGWIGAAIESRQRSVKTEYLRAFGNLLAEVHNLALTKPIMHAMAIVANVAINLPDVDVNYDDVRKALAKLGGDPLKNSNKE